jgi:outer membrane lipopolysaccharide assembly protein LptE/RlpB
MKRASFTLVILVAASLCACSYHLAGHETTLPKTIRVIAVPAIENKTSSYRIEQKLTAATIHEFLAKTTYKIVSNPASGDAVLTGKVLSVEAVPLTFQAQTTPSSTAQATTMLVTVKCEVTLTESDTQKVLFHSDNFLFRNEYELSTDVKSFFEEQDPALDRLAKDFAQKLVAAVLENF